MALSGFFYQRFPDREKHGADSDHTAGTETDSDINAAVYYHRVGTPQSVDVLVMKDPEHPEWMFSASGTEEYVLSLHLMPPTADLPSQWSIRCDDELKRYREVEPAVDRRP